MLTFTICVSAFGIDDAFSYKYNQKLGNCGEDGLAISCEFGTCHVVPVSFVPKTRFSPNLHNIQMLLAFYVGHFVGYHEVSTVALSRRKHH
jgi:hypothetical protein